MNRLKISESPTEKYFRKTGFNVQNMYIWLVILACSASVISCKNTEAELFEYQVMQEGADVVLNQENLSIEVWFESQAIPAEGISAEFLLSDGADAFVNNTLQISGVSKNNYGVPFAFTIISEDELASKTWQVRSSNNDFTSEWGLGGFIQKEVSLDRPYDWYIDQGQTGFHSDWNCAPSSVVMASRWCERDFPHSVEDARAMYNSTGGGWYTEDIDNCLTDFGIDHSIFPLSDYREETTQLLIEEIENGNIILLAIDVHYLDTNYDPLKRVGKYYHTIKLGTGHCIVVKGFKKVDGKVFFEVYDPIGYDYTYNDGTFKGRDRYYSADNLYTAAFATWNYAFVIMGPNGRKSNKPNVKAAEIPNILIL